MSWSPFLWPVFATLFASGLAVALVNLSWRAESEGRLPRAPVG